VAQTKKKRRSKHRGTPAGTIEARGRTGRKLTESEKAKPKAARPNRYDQPPNWRSAMARAGIAAGIFFVAVIGIFRQPIAGALSISLLMFLLYIPLGFYTDQFLYRRRQRQKTDAGKPAKDKP
jgi:predicted lipid-binding transport protein (Tim44 family)